MFHTISPSHYIWHSLFFSNRVPLLSETFLPNLFVPAHLVPPFNFHFLDFDYEIFLLLASAPLHTQDTEIGLGALV